MTEERLKEIEAENERLDWPSKHVPELTDEVRTLRATIQDMARLLDLAEYVIPRNSITPEIAGTRREIAQFLRDARKNRELFKIPAVDE